VTYPFSDKLLKDFNEYKSQFEREVSQYQENNITTFKKIDEIFDSFEKNILSLLQESREALKQIFSRNLPQLSTLDAFQRDLIDFTCEKITSKERIKMHLLAFGKNLNKFMQIRQACTKKSMTIPDDTTKKIIKNTQEKLLSLNELVKKFVDKELQVEKLSEDAFDFYIENTKVFLSSKDIQHFKEVQTFETNHAHDKWIFKVLLLKDGRFVTCSADKTIRIWNFNKSIPEKVLTEHTGSVNNIILLRNGRLCSASQDKTIKIWNIEDATCERTLSGYPGPVNALLELPNYILIGGGNGEIRFWNLQCADDEKVCTRILSNRGYCKSIILLSHEEMACVSGNNVNIFKISACDYPLSKLIGHQDTIFDLLLYSDRQNLLSSSFDKTIKLWNVHRGSCLRTFKGNSQCFKMTWFKERVVAVACHNGELKLWNIFNGECVRTLKGQLGVAYRSVIDHEGALISYGLSHKISFWSN